MKAMLWILAFAGLFLVLEGAYILLARSFYPRAATDNRLDSGRVSLTAGGFIFYPAAIAGCLLVPGRMPEQTVALLVAAGVLWLVSLLDDFYDLPALPRLLVQIVAATCVAWYSFGADGGWCVAGASLFMVVMMNACNFMDGISGMLSLTSIVTLTMLLVVFSLLIAPLTFSSVSMMLIIALGVFSIFNIVKRDVVFAGDVGSVIMGLFIGWLIMELVIGLRQPGWLVLAAVWLVDVAVTLTRRILAGHNIFRPHHHHLYQQYALRDGVSHFRVSLVYAAIQLMIDAVFVFIPVGYGIYYLLFVLSALVITELKLQKFPARR